MVLRDFDDDTSHHLGWLVSTAVDEQGPANGYSRNYFRRATVVLNRTCEAQAVLARELVLRMHNQLGLQAVVVDMQTVEAESLLPSRLDKGRASSTTELVILLADYGDAFLRSLNEVSRGLAKYILQNSRHLLWISSNGGLDPNPDQGLLEGMARSLQA
ncbi:hypothetical protein B0H66DRAFT_617987 [Apodospora peruviana]|uniref:Uncharacterized protein n=1 Tax=Apodospora peruviana TaxID=516989 RepID=A0AAE0MBS2_9PEZI|nr:hypothetical protein B0H66DRAFT_617987 [Apodospora peruviana]